MKKIFLIFIFSIAILFAADETDSTRTYRMNETVITGNRFQNEMQKLPISVQVIDSARINSSNGNSVAELLENQSGILVRSYGGAGSLQTISLRGMSSDYTLVLVNGRRFTTFQIGTVDLGIFSLSDVERIEVAKGGASALFGADAVGGIVNIVTKRPVKEIFSKLSLGQGSFGRQLVAFDAGGEVEGIQLYAGGKLESAKNNFEFHYSNGLIDTMLQRKGADHKISTLSLSAASNFNDHAYSLISVRVSNADRGQPNPVTSQFQNNSARIYDNDVITTWGVDWTVSKKMLLNFSSSFRYNHETYNDPNLITQGKALSSYYFNRMLNLALSNQYSFSQEHKIFSGFEGGYGNISSNEVKQAERKQVSAYLSSQHQFRDEFDLILYPAVRYDSYSDVSEDISPKMGINIGLESLPLIRLRASYGKNFRAPTFNDLYWTAGGNTKILPEHLLSGDAGIIITTDAVGSIELEANYFSIKTKDKIVWKPGSNNIWSPVNVSAVSSTGIELNGRVSFFEDAANLNCAYTVTNVFKTSADIPDDETQGKRLPYIPKETASVNIGGKVFDVSLNAVYSFSSFRFTQSDNDPRYFLKAYELFTANVSYIFALQSLDFKIKLEGNNLFDEQYMAISGYPVPMRNYLFTTSVSIH